MRTRLGLWLALVALAVTACSDTTEPTAADGPLPEELAVGPEDAEYGKAFFEPATQAGAKEDSIYGAKGLPVSVDGSAAAVWEVRNQWADTDTREAKRAGIAWGADSGLNWDQKYAAWVQSMRPVQGHNGYTTFELNTPYGKTLPAPAIECAETALFLRAAFASWYALPFFVEASDASGRIYLGHFGFKKADGSNYGNTPNFKDRYKDYSDRAETWEANGWPSDTRLRERKLGGSQDDFQPFLFDGARAGAYFDEAFLNKRTGWFMIYLLSYFGSVNLAGSANTFNVDPRGIQAGDPLVKRWQRQGIGHVYVVKSVEPLQGDRVAAEVVSGSMPRRQPKWEDAGQSQSAFTSDYAGGPGENWDGEAYAKLGGGLKGWRTAVNKSGRWTNVVPSAREQHFIDSGNQQAIADRIETFNSILGQLSPEEKLAVVTTQIEEARNHLRRYPASCSARERRERAFDALYDLMEVEYGRRRTQVDAEYRILEDFVFPEMIYNRSKTCCWNSSTSAMHEIIMLKAQADTEDHTAQACHAPTAFYARDGGYDVFKAYATELGRAGEWVAWSADETCPQANVASDTEAEHEWTPFCEVGEAVLNGGGAEPPAPAGGDAFEPNDARGNAVAVDAGRIEASGCAGDKDFYAVEIDGSGTLELGLAFRHAEADLDLFLYNPQGDKVESSTSTSDREDVSHTVSAGTWVVEVQVYGGRVNVDGCAGYTLDISAP
ncbi:MAG: hypothetical protein KC613_10510 [Myxococcales bacterium]|nr:hypothetical protein [Myxococcales bacterium]MCB9525138.1 hypothetical protein [Myxococcales bacterium]